MVSTGGLMETKHKAGHVEPIYCCSSSLEPGYKQPLSRRGGPPSECAEMAQERQLGRAEGFEASSPVRAGIGSAALQSRESSASAPACRGTRW
ncbi:uncharacterized protein MAM_07355 [Metarhizium album ARSEF 1941]|uniref:Uncharacterized protein n=1 Tax=Metarhizium album (strain ARSEF 1941) TaxID=1081103 RepID=A0A0B2WM92_METAS|nr:uncharacterized protein MAM_07355 [Metarhizium album ARSEF 1941]KHN94759.1 hypothetical protein MAM_07355 [Metarhizium album ARSEF 1941]